jgi:hypothetical protein
MGQGMRVTVDSAMRARDVSRIRPQDEMPRPPDGTAPDNAAEPAPKPPEKRARRGEKRRLAKRRAART